jgi:AraC-like DNA-binding protein
MREDLHGVFRFSSDDIHERDRIAFVREVYGRTIVKHDIEPDRDSPFFWRAVLQTLPGLGVASSVVSKVFTRRTTSQIDSDDLVLNVTLSGRRVVRQFGHEVIVNPGEVAITRSADIASCECAAGSRFVNIRVPVAALSPAVADLDSVTARIVPDATNALSLLLSYVQTFQEADMLNDPALQHVTVAHVYDLVALTLGATREAAEAARGRGVRAARLRAIVADVINNVGRRDLSLAGVAARQSITPRYVRMLFNDEGTTFSDFVLSCRLARAHRLLCDPRHAERKIGDIAFASGFGDLSYFNRAFRRQYGATPSDIRANGGSRHSPHSAYR